MGVVLVAADDAGRGGATRHSFALLGLLGRLGDLAGGRSLLIHGLDDPDRHSLTHVTHCKAPWEIKGTR